jgi:arylsulfatase A-like enzyme
MRMSSANPVLDLAEPAGVTAPGVVAQRISPAGVLALSVWCGLIAGPLEVGAIVLRKATYDVIRLYWMSRHFVWLIPVTDLLVLLVVGLIMSLTVFLWPRSGSWLSMRVLCALTLLPALWAAFPQIYAICGFILAVGLAARLAPLLERHRVGLARCVKVSFIPLAAITPLLAACLVGQDYLAVWREERRPLPPPGSASVLLIVLDTVAAGHLSLHGYERPTSPTLDALAARAIRFERVQATSSWTLPSHASMFTGRWPHDLSAGWLTPLDRTHPTLAEYLGSHGYTTAGFVANIFYCAVDSGLARGFARYQDYIFPQLSAFNVAAIVNRPLSGIRSLNGFIRQRLHLVPLVHLLGWFDAGNRKPAAVVSREFLDWLDQRPQATRPFFAFLNYYDVHSPYQVREGGIHRFGIKPRTDREMDLIENLWTEGRLLLSAREIAFARDAYDDCIADLDEQLGRLLDELERRGTLDHTWLIVTSDHGEAFNEHPGDFGHGTTLYQTQLHVPLLVVPPKAERLKRAVTETVSLRDLAATIVDVLDLEAGSPLPGESLARFWKGGSSENPPGSHMAGPVLSEVVPTEARDPDLAKLLYARQAWGAVAEGDWIYIQREGVPQDELFDLRADPKQLHNLAADPARQAVLAHLRQTLDNLAGGALTHKRFNF